MSRPDPRIIDFIVEHHILTLAVAKDNIPYCATCYYSYNRDNSTFIIASNPETRHIQDLQGGLNSKVAWAIALETKTIGKIRGIQSTGSIMPLEGEELSSAKEKYLKHFPMARMVPKLTLWSLEPDFIKMTDNRLGFGTKIIWLKSDSEV